MVESNKIYLFRKFFHNHKLCPRLSAKRSQIWHISRFLKTGKNINFSKTHNSESNAQNQLNLIPITRQHVCLHYIKNLSLDSQIFCCTFYLKLDIFCEFSNFFSSLNFSKELFADLNIFKNSNFAVEKYQYIENFCFQSIIIS